MTPFPPEILTEILSRLPPKPLTRFKTVAKPWNSLISSPNFIKRHLNQTLISHLILSHQGHHSLSTAEIPATTDNLSFSAVDHPVPPTRVNSNVHLLGSRNGVVCITDRYKTTYFLFNPTTKTHRLIPPPPTRMPPPTADPFATFPSLSPPTLYQMIFGFGYDPGRDDYMLFRAIEGYSKEVTLYSMRDNSWKCVEEDTGVCVYRDLDMDGVDVNGVLHFMVVGKNGGGHMVKCFDLRDESFSYVEMFEIDKTYDHYELVIREMGGCFSVMVNYQNYDYDVAYGLCLSQADFWVLKEGGNAESWVKLFSVEDWGGRCLDVIRPIMYSKDGRRVLLEFEGLRFGWYDWGSSKLERIKASGLPSRESPFVTLPLMASIVSVGIDKEEKPKRKPVPQKNIASKKNVAGFLSTGFKLKL